MSKTVIIEFYGGPGTGKSTSAADAFAMLKRKDLNAELVREYVKEWAWENRHIGAYDQLYFFGKQTRKESLLYGKVDYIVTDSPIALSAFYALKHNEGALSAALADLVKAFYADSEARGFVHVPVFLARTKKYNAAGRYQTEDEAREMDGLQYKMLEQWFGATLRVSGTERPYLEDCINRIVEETK